MIFVPEEIAHVLEDVDKSFGRPLAAAVAHMIDECGRQFVQREFEFQF